MRNKLPLPSDEGDKIETGYELGFLAIVFFFVALAVVLGFAIYALR